MKQAIIGILSSLLLPGTLQAGTKPPQQLSLTLDRIMQDAVRDETIPGGVLLVWNRGKVIHRKAYGYRALVPRREMMTTDTIFDLASLTKVVATVPALMRLFEEGKLRLNDRVTHYLPEFQQGKSEITVRQLLTHFSGLRPDLDLEPPWSGYETGIRLALHDKPVAQPGERFIYSDINFILLGEIVRRLSGKPLDLYTEEVVFRPLGMHQTRFRPSASLHPRIAPTEILPGTRSPLRGIVHDPTARYMGGIAGHAGLFGTADDLARFAQMMLGEGRLGSTRVFSPLTVRKFTTPQSPPDQPILRGLGWDIDSPYSANRGELFPLGGYGHTGFTGTSLWIDPATQSFVILLTNSVHPKPRQAITSLRARVSTAVAAALGIELPGVQITGYNEAMFGVRRAIPRNGRVLTGLDVLAARNFEDLRGKRVGLITNHTGLDRDGHRNLDLMLAAGVQVTAVFAPEHGLQGASEGFSKAPFEVDQPTGIRVWNLYTTTTRRPTSEMLQAVDVLVYDIQDVGARFYTYITTLGYCLEEAARHGKTFYVLDRPNPLNGARVEGPMLDPDLLSFVGYFPLPLRHGMTVGELAQLFNEELGLGVDLHVIPMRGWERGDWFDSTGLTWVNPSPNLRSLNAALLYPGLAMLEAASNLSVGRGTDAPFEQVGASWINAALLARELNSRYIPGVRVYPVRFRPSSSVYEGTLIEGVRFVITDRESFSAQRLGLELASALLRLFPGKLDLERTLHLLGSRETMKRLLAGEDPRQIEQDNQENLAGFLSKRSKHLLYQ